MSFPDWAPPALVKEFEKLQTTCDDLRKGGAEVEEKSKQLMLGQLSDWDEIGLEEERVYYKEELVEKDKLRDILFRLLTNFDMKAVWEELSRHQIELRIKTGDRVLTLWNNGIVHALNDFQLLIAHPTTAAQKRKNLLGVSAKAQALLEAINADPMATALESKLVTYFLAIRNNEYREDMGEEVCAEERDLPLTLSADCHEAWQQGRDEYEWIEGLEWRGRPLIARLAYWTKEAAQIKLTELLQLYIKFLNAKAERPPEIKQPGRAEAAIKPFLIRRLREHMIFYHGQPLDEVVGRVVSIVLNLETPLTRDDIRPYIKDPGKKFIADG